MKFHTDEHVPAAVALGLRRRGFDLTTSLDAHLVGASDLAQLAYCQKEERVLITHDADMLRLAAAGTAHAGIAYCHNQQYKVGQVIRKILAMAGSIPAVEMLNRIEFL